MMRSRWPAPLASGIAALAAVLALSSCSSGITAARLDPSVGRAFSHLWQMQQTEEGVPPAQAVAARTAASCKKGGPSTPDAGAGNDWVCTIRWVVAGAPAPATALYNLNVRTNGCYTADGDGPAQVNGQRTLVDSRGHTVINPLWEFDGCFET